jgi:hypothetical protein
MHSITRALHLLARTLAGAMACAMLAVTAIFGKSIADHWASLPAPDLALGIFACLLIAACAVAIVWRDDAEH